MAWSVGPCNVEDTEDVPQLVADLTPDEADEEQVAAAVAAVQALIASDQVGTAPWRVSIAAHPPVAQTGSKPYVAVSVIGETES